MPSPTPQPTSSLKRLVPLLAASVIPFIVNPQLFFDAAILILIPSALAGIGLWAFSRPTHNPVNPD